MDGPRRAAEENAVNIAQARPGDRVRQAAVLVLAVAQAAVTGVAGARIQEQVDRGPRSPVEPAGYAFAIWGLIFFFCIGYGMWQARPGEAANPLPRRIGWPTAGAFLSIVGWSVVVPVGLFWLAQMFLLATWGFLAVAAIGLADEGRLRTLTGGERWFVALPLAPFFGWVTAANGVSLHGQAVDFGLVNPTSPGSRFLGAALLLAVGLVAGWVVRRCRTASPPFWAIYAATVGWAIVAVVVAQWGAEPWIVVAAILAAGPALLAAAGNGSPPGFRPAAGTPAA